MGLFSKKVDYDELYRKLSSEKMTPEEARKAEKELKKLAKSGDKRGVIWRPLTSVQIQSVGSVNWATSELEEAENKYGICEEYVRVRSLPIVFNLFNESYEKYNDPKGAVFVARAYEHGWGVEKNHGKAVEIIRETENYPKDGTFRLNSDLIKNAYKEITGTEFPDSESSKQKEKQAISDAAKNQNEQPQSDINFKRLELDGGDVYEGYFLNEKKNGHGKYIWANGDVFDGNWVDGKRTGKGKVTWSNGASFDGEWKDDQMSEGKYTFPDGEIYDGSFQNGKKEGYGKQVFPNGEKYEGQWRDGKKHGHGTYTWADGDTYEGDWKDGKRCGRGKVIQYGKVPATGETYMKYSYDGEWLDSKEHGHGICVEGDFGWEKMDKVFEGEWVNGKRQGRFVWYFTNSKGGRYIDFYEDGKPVETCIPYDESIKTVEDAKRFREAEKMYQVPAQTAAHSIKTVVRRLRNPGEAPSRAERNIENACMMLAPFMTEAENLFLKGEEEKALEIIEEMLDINIVPDDEWYYNSDTKYFSQFLSGALYSLANQIDFDTPDHDRFIVPAANIACYLWKKYGDYSLFGSVAFLWSATEKDQCGNFLWLKRMRDNGDYTVVSRYNESSEYYFGHDLDRYTMGSDCELF